MNRRAARAAARGDGVAFRHLPAESLGIGALITALVALGQISTSLYTPSLPSLAQALHATQQQANLTLSLFLIGFAPAQLVIGTLSDRYGRRPVLMIGLLAYIAASFACALAPTIGILLLGRFVQGIAACTGPVLSRAIVRDIYGAERSATALAYVGAALAISPAVAPIIGGYLQLWYGWRSAFLLQTALGIVLCLASHWLLPETRLADPPGRRRRFAVTTRSVHWRVLSEPGYLANTLAVAWVFAGLMAYTVSGPFIFIDQMGLSPQHFGMLAIVTVAGYLAGSLTAARLSRRRQPHQLMPLGLLLTVTGGVAASAFAIASGGTPAIPEIVVPMAIFCAGVGIVFAAGIAGALAPFPEVAGTASAWLGFLQMAVAAAATTVLGAFEMASATPMALALLISAGLATACYMAFGRGRHRQQ